MAKINIETKKNIHGRGRKLFIIVGGHYSQLWLSNDENDLADNILKESESVYSDLEEGILTVIEIGETI